MIDDKPDLIMSNYCICFLDLLGQKNEYKGEGLVHHLKDAEKKFKERISKTIKPIYNLQKDAYDFLKGAKNYKGKFKEELNIKQQKQLEQMNEIHLNIQRWSDGIVYFVPLYQDSVKCPMTGIYNLFGAAGSICLLGLCRKFPIRGGVDISWGVELHPGEIYGAAVANAYDLESKVAKLPRIVIGERVVGYLETTRQTPEEDVFSQFSRKLAEICLNMIAVDFDGNYIIDYLGETFKECVTKKKHKQLFKLSYQFVKDQLFMWRNEKNTKLAMRYNHLLAYYEANKKLHKN